MNSVHMPSVFCSDGMMIFCFAAASHSAVQL